MINLVIIEDDSVIAEGLKYSVQFNGKYSVKNIYSSAESALLNILEDSPNIIILDISLPGKSGVEIISDLRIMLPETDILMLTSSDDDDDIFNALKLGASGYLQKDLDIENLLEALDEIVSGGSPLSGSVARKVLKSMQVDKLEISFTGQESTMVDYIAKGFSQKEISEKMFISLSTVKFHCKNIYEKLGVNTKAEAITKLLSVG
jgi:DNA-binding NarL/FixJ family response regulator